MTSRIPALTLLIVLPSLVTTGCLWGPDRICSGDQTVVQRAEDPNRGRWCEKRQPGDPECDEGERALRVESTGRTDCVADRV